MLRSFRILLLSSLTLLPARAMAANSDNPAGDDAKARALAAAIEACDKGASVPLDPTAKAPPVQFGELLPYDFDMTKLRALQADCQKAWVGAPKQTRLELEWLRVTVALNEPSSQWLLPQVRKLADKGSAEAQFLLYQLHNRRPAGEDGVASPVSKAEALASLSAAAEQGHLTALMQMTWQYRNGTLVRRDPEMAVRMARRVESAPPQGIAETRYEADVRGDAALTIALLTLQENGFSPRDQRIAFRTVETISKQGTSEDAVASLAYIKALRLGRGVQADPARARQLLETRVAGDKFAVAVLADMLVKGEGGPADPKRALALLRDPRMEYVTEANAVLAELLLDGKAVGRQPQEAITALARSWYVKDYIRLAGLLVDYHPRIDNADAIVSRLAEAAANGEPGAALALARLKLSDDSQFTDVEGARALLKPLVDAGDRAALWLYAASQYTNLDSSSFTPYRQSDGFTDDELRRLLKEGAEKKEADAFLLTAKLMRRGVLYPQDDQAATNALISAANLGNVEAMVLLGDAYDEGIGTAKDPRARLKAWRLAASLGSLKARKELADAFIFDTFDRLMTLEEGVTGRLVLSINGYGRNLSGLGVAGDMIVAMDLAGLFSFGGRAMEAGPDAVAEAVMNAFREAPAGLADAKLVSLGKALPDEIRIAIEKKLKSEGVYSGETAGQFDPSARKALADWVEAKGPPNASASDAAESQQQPIAGDDLVPPEIIARIRDRAFKEAMAAKGDRQKLTSLSQLNALARYGDMAARWALLRNYHQAKVVRKAVTPAEITRYGLDILVARPEGMDKAEFEFIFVVSQLYQDGKIDEFADAVLTAVRDDKRLQDPLALGGIMKELIFAPGACDAVLDAAKKARIKGIGGDGCGDDTLAAIVAFAKTEGASGDDADARKAAALEIRAMDDEAAE